MRRDRLIVFASGAGCAVIAYLGAVAWTEMRHAEAKIVLTYVKPDGLKRHSPEYYKNDPGRASRSAAEYLGFVANRCHIASWQIDAGFPATDADYVSKLIVSRDKLTDAAFNCLGRFVIAPNVQISQVSSH